MNRLSPLIERRPPALFGQAIRASGGGIAGTASRPAMQARFEPFGDPPPSAGQWRMFATSYLAGLVFFGTFLA